MAIIEVERRRDAPTQRQRYSHYFALAFGVIGLFIGMNLRDSALFATTQYVNTEAGIRALYPQNWLLDTESGDYVFRVRDMTQTGFKTTIQVTILPVGAATTARNVLESLSLRRSQTLAEYTIFSVEPYPLSDERPATAMAYAYAGGVQAPFLASVPAVVRALDVLTIASGQAVIITFLSDASSYDRNLSTFERFLSQLEF